MSDLIFPSDNEWGVPSLTLETPELCSPAVVAPAIVWGSTRRKRVDAGTIVFYTDDYRFTKVWTKPEAVSATAIVEPNYSVYDDSPAAVALWATYRKRYLSAFWQREGAQVWVDLCVAERHTWINLLGVPRGWQRYATAGWDARVAELDHELATAERQAAGYPFTLMVYGGGNAVKSWCEGRANVVHVGHRADARKRAGEGTRNAGPHRISGI